MRIAILGAGKVGTALARLALQAGHDVAISGSGRNPMAAMIVESLAPGARLVSEREAIADAEVLIAAVPFSKAKSIDWGALDGRIVVDAMNYWEAVDGKIQEAAQGNTTALIQTFNPSMRLVKSLNHRSYDDLEVDAKAPGAAHRVGMLVASDDAEAAQVVACLVDSLGFEPVIAPLAAGKLAEPSGPLFEVRLSAEELRGLVSS